MKYWQVSSTKTETPKKTSKIKNWYSATSEDKPTGNLELIYLDSFNCTKLNCFWHVYILLIPHSNQ